MSTGGTVADRGAGLAGRPRLAYFGANRCYFLFFGSNPYYMSGFEHFGRKSHQFVVTSPQKWPNRVIVS